jgi:hypothetical protein
MLYYRKMESVLFYALIISFTHVLCLVILLCVCANAAGHEQEWIEVIRIIMLFFWFASFHGKSQRDKIRNHLGLLFAHFGNDIYSEILLILEAVQFNLICARTI